MNPEVYVFRSGIFLGDKTLGVPKSLDDKNSNGRDFLEFATV